MSSTRTRPGRGLKASQGLSLEDRERLNSLRIPITARLNDFAAVPWTLWGREIAFCLLTPQSSALHAEACIAALESRRFFSGVQIPEAEVAAILRESTRYIRFHHTKARRLVEFQSHMGQVVQYLRAGHSPLEERQYLRESVKGLGLKESSHALRNIGRRGLAILDRHILRNLVRCGAIKKIPKTLTEARYGEIERSFTNFAAEIGEEIDVLDLFFWAREAGTIFK